MITDRSFDRRLAEWLEADAQGRVGNHLAEVLVASRATRQRPAWSSLERWLPMDIPMRLRLAPTTPWLALLLVTLLAAAAIGIALVGSQRHGPLPYGPAGNGPLLHAELDGDLHLFDPATGSDRVLVSGPTDDYQPRFSLDGMRIAYLRETDDGILVVGAESSGANPRVLAGPFPDVESMSWAGDSRRLAVVHERDGAPHSLIVIDVAAGTSDAVDLGVIEPVSVSWLPPDGAEIVVQGRRGHTGVWAVRPDGTGIRPLSPEDGSLDGGYGRPTVSPDGRLLAYTTWDGVIMRTSIRDLARDRVVTLPDLSPTSHRYPIAWSPDSSWLLTGVNTLDGPAPASGTSQLYLFPADGSGDGRPIGPEFSYEPEVLGVDAAISPDGRFVYIVHGEDHLLWTVPVAFGTETTSPFAGTNIGSVQRLLP